MSSDPWSWLGLLKWSLSYSDGTAPSDANPMSKEDREFLERVMKEGIIDENERMKSILKRVTDQIQVWKDRSFKPEEVEEVQVALDDLRGIVEQIDYARAFAAMKGLPFLIGCASEREKIPRSTRLDCLGVLSTMAQHNPPVQKELLELGALKTFSDLYFVEEEQDVDGEFRARIIQAISATVRGYDLGETVFCQLEQAVSLLQASLGVERTVPPLILPTLVRRRSLFFLRAIVTSDDSTRDRVRLFSSCIGWVADHFLNDDSLELREMTLSLLVQILEQRKSVDDILQRKDVIVASGVARVAALRNLTGEDSEDAAVELESWEQLLILLARATPDEGVLPSPTIEFAG